MYSNLFIGFCNVECHIEEPDFKSGLYRVRYFLKIPSSSKINYGTHLIFFVLLTLNKWLKFDGKKSGVTTQKLVKINKFMKRFVFSKKYSHTILKLKH